MKGGKSMDSQKTWAYIVGIVLVIAGIIGFVAEPILGVFEVNILHNLVHIITGLIFLWGAAKGPAKITNKTLGWIYVVVAILGFFELLTFLAVAGGNDPDNWLHLSLGIVSLLVAYSAKN
jgi:hypothetical protein